MHNDTTLNIDVDINENVSVVLIHDQRFGKLSRSCGTKGLLNMSLGCFDTQLKAMTSSPYYKNMDFLLVALQLR
jgi:hypothetical protein